MNRSQMGDLTTWRRGWPRPLDSRELRMPRTEALECSPGKEVKVGRAERMRGQGLKSH